VASIGRLGRNEEGHSKELFTDSKLTGGREEGRGAGGGELGEKDGTEKSSRTLVAQAEIRNLASG